MPPAPHSSLQRLGVVFRAGGSAACFAVDTICSECPSDCIVGWGQV